MNKNAKIALLVNSFWNAGAGISGGDQRLMQIFKRIGKNFQIDIYTSADGKKIIAEEIKSATFYISPKEFEKGNIFLRYRRRSNWLIKKLKNHHYDYIYSSSDFFPDVLPAYQYKSDNPKTKWIACVFHIYPNWRVRPGSKIRNIVGSKIQDFSLARIKKADKIINVNYQVRDNLISKYQIPKDKIVINSCGIDLEYFRKIKAAKKRYQACFLARLMPSKGIFDLPEIWAKVVKKIPTAKLKIIGGGSDEVKLKLKNQFTKLGLSKNAEILGFLPNDKAYKILKESNLFVFPSHEEGFGIVIAEAFACGLPVVAWNLPVYREVFAGAVVEAKIANPNQFAKETIKILESKSLQAKFVAKSENVIEQYRWQAIVEKELRIIEKS
ncbi:hypothetical protein COT12_02820 [Candidatus Berkelbacteria bacterium CG08_land_8_20_14_0_20_39_8]|uniref:Glycosyl transferase family 1 domain-containing protein n=1 Tax=Candidatus Berkelbacteria bacterium CG08_land_8_20_14_0_20_39_8 TaxID=1974511 RepID=A0A2M6YBP4_9BACT|nr:MAG: hypothetical protein COT12_02820 [Candidatus Berkelbacteria bacterium CG08_land_8_20_14_0_20_39_8]